MKTLITLRRLFKLTSFLLVCSLPMAAQALTSVEISSSQAETWASTNETVTVPAGSVYNLTLPNGDIIVLTENTQFKVVKKDGKIERVVILNGTAIVRRDKRGSGDAIIFEVDGKDITSTGADLAVSVTGDSTTIAQMGTAGTVSVNGTPIPAGAGGTVNDDGSFTSSNGIDSRLSATATKILRDATGTNLPGNIPDNNLNDVSPN